MEVGGLILEESSSSWNPRAFSAMFEDPFTAPAGSVSPDLSLDLNEASTGWDEFSFMKQYEDQITVPAGSESRNLKPRPGGSQH